MQPISKLLQVILNTNASNLIANSSTSVEERNESKWQ